MVRKHGQTRKKALLAHMSCMQWKRTYQQLYENDYVPFRCHSISRIKIKAPGAREDIVHDTGEVSLNERRHELTLDNYGDIKLATYTNFPLYRPSKIRLSGLWDSCLLMFRIKFNGNIMYNIYAIGHIEHANEHCATMNVRYNLRSGKSYFRNYGTTDLSSVKPGQESAQRIHQFVRNSLPEIREALGQLLAQRDRLDKSLFQDVDTCYSYSR
jgi:hypothetical protein